MDAVEKYRQRRDARIKKRMDDFKENDHPRDENGRFTSGGGAKKAKGGKKDFEALKKQYEKDMSTTGKLSLSGDELYELSKDPEMRKKMHDDLVGDDGYNAKYWKEHPVSGGKYFGKTAD